MATMYVLDDKPFTVSETNRLLSFYRREETLWNMSAPDYHKKEARNAAVQRITVDMGAGFTGKGPSQKLLGII